MKVLYLAWQNEANNRVDNGNQDYVFEYDQYENAKDEEFEADCPKKCPARIMMVCARCKHGVYRTFLSICHMRMFNCQKAGERLQLVAREPCAVSAPHLATAEEYPDGKVGEPYDNDQVLHFIHSRNKEKVEILSEFLLNEMALANSRTNKSLDHDEELFLLNYNPDKENVYHLYTRKNRDNSQAMLLNDEKRLKSSNYDAQKKTVVLIHGWTNDMECHFYQTVTAAYLRAEDVNVITVDWSAGAKTEYLLAVRNTEKSGISVAKFLNWLNDLTGSTADKYHIVGFSLGGHQAGIAARHLKGNVRYVTALDPALPLWQSRPEKLRKSDGVYVEVIHTNAGDLGFVDALGDVDFYMNGGKTQPGCPTQNVLKKMVTPSCNHARAYHYFAESLQSSGFVGTKCNTAVLALNKNCPGSGKIVMGGIKPKMGLTGIYSVLTNDKAPFAKSRSS